jgi:hypothetical protein
VADDSVERLWHWLHEAGDCVLCDAADEIERLRAALAIAAGILSTLPQYETWHPEAVLGMLMQEADRG